MVLLLIPRLLFPLLQRTAQAPSLGGRIPRAGKPQSQLFLLPPDPRDGMWGGHKWEIAVFREWC